MLKKKKTEKLLDGNPPAPRGENWGDAYSVILLENCMCPWLCGAGPGMGNGECGARVLDVLRVRRGGGGAGEGGREGDLGAGLAQTLLGRALDRLRVRGRSRRRVGSDAAPGAREARGRKGFFPLRAGNERRGGKGRRGVVGGPPPSGPFLKAAVFGLKGCAGWGLGCWGLTGVGARAGSEARERK